MHGDSWNPLSAAGLRIWVSIYPGAKPGLKRLIIDGDQVVEFNLVVEGMPAE